jgi:HPt (histidine-containing phosphotransfer) domain-containing protein
MATAFDIDELLDRLGGDRETVAELIEIFLEDTPPRVDDLRQPVADFDGVRRTAHTIKGASGNMAAHAASAAAARLETAAAQGDHEAAEAARLDLVREMDLLFAEMARCRGTLTGGAEA